MRICAIALLAAFGAAGCVAREQPYRFASPMVAGADVPPPTLVGPPRPLPRDREPRSARPADVAATSRSMLPPIRTVSAAGVEPSSATATATASASDTTTDADATPASLPAPHRLPADAPLPAIHAPLDLRALVGRRDRRTPIAVALAWSAALGHPIDAGPSPTGAELLAFADAANRLASPRATTLLAAAPGDLVIFDDVEGAAADLVGVVIAHDARGVTEFAYLGAGVVRRGFVDPARPAVRRDTTGAVVNTYVRTGRRWPPAGTHYLAGELLAHIVRF